MECGTPPLRRHAVEMTRLDTAQIQVQPEISRLDGVARRVVASMQSGIDDRPIEVVSDGEEPPLGFDRRLVNLAIKQLLDNALKYPPSAAPVTLRIRHGDKPVTLEVVDHGTGISVCRTTPKF